MSDVKFSQLEDTSANIETSKRPLLMGFDTTVKEIFYIDSAEDKYTAVTKDESGVLPSLEITELTTGAISSTEITVAGTIIIGDGDSSIAGNLGIGTTTPAEKLDVVGSIRQNLYSLRMSKTISQPQSATNNYVHFKMAIPTRTAVTVKAVFVGTHSTTGIKADIELFYSRGDSTSSASVVTMQCNSVTRTLMYTVDATTDELWIGVLNSGGTANLIGTLYVEILSNKASDISGSTPRFVADMVTAAYTIPSNNRYIDSVIATPGALLDGAVTINESGADVDFRVESDTDQNAIFVEGSNGRIGFGTATPADKVDVNGNAKAHSLIGSRKLYAAEAPNSYYGINEDLEIETDDVDDYIDIALPANTAIAHIIVDVVVQHGSGTSLDYTAILDAWVHVSNDKVETTTRCENQTSQPWLTIDETLASGKVRIRLDGGTSGATDNRIANVRGQIVEYLEIAS